MSREVVFGIGGWCENCDPSHDHPPHNIVEIIDNDEVVDDATDPR